MALDVHAPKWSTNPDSPGFRGFDRSGVMRAASPVLAVLLALVLLVPLASAATITRAWQAKVGTNGVVRVYGYDTGAGAVRVTLRSVPRSQNLAMSIRKGSCKAVGSALVTLPTMDTLSTGKVVQTVRLSAANLDRVRLQNGKVVVLRIGLWYRCAPFVAFAVPKPSPTSTPPPGSDPKIIGAGDICIQSRLSSAQKTAALIRARPADAVFTLGDNSNGSGTAAQYTDCYGSSWGAFLDRTHAAMGNHDAMTSNGAPYYAYFGTHAGPAGKGYYSYDLPNNWHVIVLNAICPDVPGGCSSGSPQETWLKDDLAAHPGMHIIAIWHVPSFSSGSTHGNSSSYRSWWNDLYSAGADVILNGHDHDYERFARQDPAGRAAASGIREFVVGTGGAGTRSWGTVRTNSEARSLDLGVLELTLHRDSYSWRFISANGSFADSGTTATNTGD